MRAILAIAACAIASAGVFADMAIVMDESMSGKAVFGSGR